MRRGLPWREIALRRGLNGYNEGIHTAPDFQSEVLAQSGGTNLVAPSGRSSPAFLDLDGDGVRDLLVGNTEGQLLLYTNVGDHGAPSFSVHTFVESDGVPIDLPDVPRSRPFPCDWTRDGMLDVLVGSADGHVRLYQGLPGPGDCTASGAVDIEDLAQFVTCLGGPSVPVAKACTCADLDVDADVDMDDYKLFQITLTGL